VEAAPTGNSASSTGNRSWTTKAAKKRKRPAEYLLFAGTLTLAAVGGQVFHFVLHGPHDERQQRVSFLSSSSSWPSSSATSPLIVGLLASRGGNIRMGTDENNSTAATRTATKNDEDILLAAKNVCLSSECVRSAARELARAFPDRHLNAPAIAGEDGKELSSSWCIRNGGSNDFDSNNNDNAFVDSDGRYRGLVLVKVPKAASSTSAGVAIRIGRRHNCDAVQWMHRMAYEYGGGNDSNSSSSSSAGKYEITRDRDSRFVLTTVRDPGARAVSSIFFHTISRQAADPTDEVLLRELRHNTDDHYGTRSDGQGGFQLRYTSFQAISPGSFWSARYPTSVVDPERLSETVRQAVQSYDFVIVPERMEESLVAMAIVMGIDVGDVLVTSSKVAGGSRYHLVKPANERITCLPIARSFTSSGVASYLASDEWRAANYGDYLLYEAANQSLDRTINRIGHQRFNAALAEYRRLKAMEEQKCALDVVFPCSNDGKPQPKLARESCYLRNYDFGCGYKCIDQMLLDDARSRSDTSQLQV